MKKILTLSIVFLTMTLMAWGSDGVDIKKLKAQGFEIVNIENEGVRRYMADRTYEDSSRVGNYAYSIVLNYSKGYGSRPNGKTVRWKLHSPEEDVEKIIVSVSQSADYEEQ